VDKHDAQGNQAVHGTDGQASNQILKELRHKYNFLRDFAAAGISSRHSD
jgi:hypothetical protein